MKHTKLSLSILLLALCFTSCQKLKFDDKPYLKFEANGTPYSYEDEVLYADIATIDNVEVWSISKGCGACEHSFSLQSRTSMEIDTPQPVIYLINGDAAALFVGNVYYKLQNGVVTLRHMSTTSGGNAYMEGKFSLTLINNSNNLDTVHVTNGSFFHNNY